MGHKAFRTWWGISAQSSRDRRVASAGAGFEAASPQGGNLLGRLAFTVEYRIDLFSLAENLTDPLYLCLGLVQAYGIFELIVNNFTIIPRCFERQNDPTLGNLELSQLWMYGVRAPFLNPALKLSMTNMLGVAVTLGRLREPFSQREQRVEGSIICPAGSCSQLCLVRIRHRELLREITQIRCLDWHLSVPY
ncbi:hypothetical protein OCJ37_14185 [Xanthomonas sp. AM6]|uniref:hypothetical protein n=1 Tax=Xanthomonas sp. AM6 TaxID=2982531 RepID=UPI0021D833E9|nr:hypothetical protein [Xanthomonas sp. AM6]UYB51134.1 hypothetical protein OCJ37_14185 [Xanthomonas sp. AM6]